MSFIVEDVTEASASGRKNNVVFDEDRSYIENKTGGKRLHTQDKNKTYIIDIYIKDLSNIKILGC